MCILFVINIKVAPCISDNLLMQINVTLIEVYFTSIDIEQCLSPPTISDHNYKFSSIVYILVSS